MKMSTTTIANSNDGVTLLTGQNYEVVAGYVKSPVYLKCTIGGSVAAVEANF